MLLKGGCIINSDRKYLADVLIENNIIKQIGVDLVAPSGIAVVNITNKLIIPGGIDPSTNFNLNPENRDVLKSDSRLALEGGTTTIINKLSSLNGGSILSTLQAQGAQLKNTMFCNFGFYVNLDVKNENCLKEMKEIVHTQGINCFEINIGSNVTKNIMSVMKECTELGCLLRIRAEDSAFKTLLEQSLIDEGVTGPDGFIRSRLIEDEIESLYRVLKLNWLCKSALFVPQVMNKDTATIISAMKKSGRSIFCETIAAALATDADKYYLSNWDEAASVVTEPPLRQGQTTELIRCLQNGDVDMLASQHATISVAERAKGQKDFREIPHGIVGVKERLLILWERGVSTGMMDECEFVAATSANAAKLFNLYPKRGYIGVGSVADLVIWNPEKAATTSSTNGHRTSESNIFDCLSGHCGGPELVILNGEIKYQNNCVIEPPSGEKTDLKNNCKLIVDKMKQYDQRTQLDKVVVDHSYNSAAGATAVNDANSKENVDDDSGQKVAFTGKTQRPPTSGGNRNMQDSSFAFSGAQIDDSRPNRSSIRTNQPPGGKSSNIW